MVETSACHAEDGEFKPHTQRQISLRRPALSRIAGSARYCSRASAVLIAGSVK